MREQGRLAAVASQLAGRKVGVHCPSFLSSLVDTGGEAGRVRFDESGRAADYTDLSPQTCKELRHLDRIDFSCVDNDYEVATPNDHLIESQIFKMAAIREVHKPALVIRVTKRL